MEVRLRTEVREGELAAEYARVSELEQADAVRSEELAAALAAEEQHRATAAIRSLLCVFEIPGGG